MGVAVRGSRFKTKVIRSTNDPVWNETFTFGAIEDLDKVLLAAVFVFSTCSCLD